MFTISIKNAVTISIASLLLLSSCGTINQLALQWKHRGEYRKIGNDRTGIATNSTKIQNETPSSDKMKNVNSIDLLISEMNEKAKQTSEIEKLNATASIENTSKVSDTKDKTMNTIVSKKEVRKAVFSALKENGITKLQALKTINKLQKENKENGGSKNQWVALILCWLIGSLGIHRFYLGYIWQGVVQILTFGGCGIWVLVDFIRILIGTLKPKDGEYGTKI